MISNKQFVILSGPSCVGRVHWSSNRFLLYLAFSWVFSLALLKADILLADKY